MGDTRHVPVLLRRVTELLAPALDSPGAVLVDATLGLGGHTEAVLEAFPQVHVVGIDRDPRALAASRLRLERFAARVSFVEAVYDEVGAVLDERGHRCAQAILFDLGVSSMQLDEVDRGFSYARDAPLDMRMGAGRMTAADVLNTYSSVDLARVLRTYGEEKFARRIADAVVSARAEHPFDTSSRLVEVVRAAVPAAARRSGGNPAKRTFQALRIEVNDELTALRRALPDAIDSVCVGGRIVAMAYHSLEDRLVKRAFARVTTLDVPPGLPVVPSSMQPRFRLVTRGAETAPDEEVAANRRAKSVRLRAVERVAA